MQMRKEEAEKWRRRKGGGGSWGGEGAGNLTYELHTGEVVRAVRSLSEPRIVSERGAGGEEKRRGKGREGGGRGGEKGRRRGGAWEGGSGGTGNGKGRGSGSKEPERKTDARRGRS
eukprot:765806-Hanusia_phi.AAC.4